MGIKGLWRALKPYVRDGHLGQFRGQRVAVDMYVWLHQSVRGCITINYDALMAYLEAKYTGPDGQQASIALEDLVVVSSRYIDFIVNKIDALQRFGVTPVCVFDGAEMPMKRGTDADRQQRRETCFREALALLDSLYKRTCASEKHRASRQLDRHSPVFSEAVQLLERAVDISTELAHAVLQVLREERHVECIVAPYEADAELSYLCREGYVQAAVSEDSDLLAYFCPRVIAKLDAFSGRCEVLVTGECAPCFFADMAAMALRKKPATAGQLNSKNSTAGIVVGGGNKEAAAQDTGHAADITSDTPAEAAQKFTYESFLLGCVMSGCDYVPNLRSIGVKTAFKLVAQAHSLPHLLHLLEVNYGFGAEEMKRYQRQLLAAFYCFAHHIVYCPRRKEVVHYHPLPPAASGSPASLSSSSSQQERANVHKSTTNNSNNKSAACAMKGRTELIGECWPATLAQKVCEDCLLDPCTHELYKGQYQHCLNDYLQRTRRGQTSLKQFAGFERQEVSKVVVRLTSAAASTARSQVSRLLEKTALFRNPLAKVREGSGYCGATAATLTTVRSKYFALASLAAVEAESANSSSTSLDTKDEDEDEEDEDEESGATDVAHADVRRGKKKEEDKVGRSGVQRCTMQSTTESSGTTLDEETYDTCMSPPLQATNAPAAHQQSNSSSGSPSSSSSLPAGVHGLSRHRTSHSSSSQQQEQQQQRMLLGVSEEGMLLAADQHAESDTAPHAKKASATTSSRGVEVCEVDNEGEEEEEVKAETCACPFGYWQCNKAHSIFEQCFQGKDWVRGERATRTASKNTAASAQHLASPSSLPTSPATSSSSSTLNCVGRFRPPQSRKRDRAEDSCEGSEDTSPSRRCRRSREEGEEEREVDVDALEGQDEEEQQAHTSAVHVAEKTRPGVNARRPFRAPRPAPSATSEQSTRGNAEKAEDEGVSGTEGRTASLAGDEAATVFARYMFVARKARSSR